MYRAFYEGWTTLPLLGFLFFVLAFGLVLLRTFLGRDRRELDADAALPLNDSTHSEVKP